MKGKASYKHLLGKTPHLGLAAQINRNQYPASFCLTEVQFQKLVLKTNQCSGSEK